MKNLLITVFVSLAVILIGCGSLEEDTKEVKELLAAQGSPTLVIRSTSFAIYAIELHGDDLSFFYEDPLEKIEPTMSWDLDGNGTLDSAYYVYPSNIVYSSLTPEECLFDSLPAPPIDLTLRQKEYEMIIKHALKEYPTKQ